MSDMNDWNVKIVEEFRANAGKVGGVFEGMPMVLLHHTGRKSGTERVNPLAYQQLDGAIAIFASKGGAPTHPDWYLNLVAHPEVKAEVGSETYAATARVATGSEREAIWSKQKADYPGFAEYEEKAQGREIPVVILERA